ncbi:serine/threonine protein kinase, partial [Pyxidicoccus fallax]|nr:serine/threonine protein kinase [Pyxidicoccus fallax]
RSPEAIRFQWDYRSHPTAHYESQPADDVFALGVTAYQLVTGTYPPPPRVDLPAGSEGVTPLIPPRRHNPAVCAELDALILRMLAEHPGERLGGHSASGAAQALEEAAATAGPLADLPISGPAVGVPPAVTSAPPLRWTGLAVAIALLSLLAAVMGGLLRSEPPHEDLEVARATPDLDARDGGTVAVGDAAVASPVTILAPVPSIHVPPGFGLPMPDRPFPGQRKPPCNRKGEVELRGGCWYELARVKAPCDDDAYDYKGACYLPSFPVQRPSTSGRIDP